MTEQPDLQLNKCIATATLTKPARALHLAVLRTFTRTGRPPSRAELENVAATERADFDAAIAELADRDVVAFDQHSQVRAAYPFSPTPTAHRVTWANGPHAYAMCAIDALGISAMIGRPVTITTNEPDTGTPITVRVDNDTANWSPATTVVYAGDTGDECCPSAERTCGYINFFTSPDTARAWATLHPTVNGTILDQAHALAYGVAEFGTLLTPSSRR